MKCVAHTVPVASLCLQAHAHGPQHAPLLNRFDGYEFKVFVHDPRNANSLSGVVVTVPFMDRSAALWVGCNQFLDRLDPRTETFTPRTTQAARRSIGSKSNE
jgi:hypothetical protein